MSNYVTYLNNYLQGRKETHLLTWAESYAGPCHQVEWTVQCKIGGVVKGTGVGASKADARQAAAQEALTALRSAQ
ncbi:hypothetical protein M413DRAFT_439259 [Hebeloma cylindrosporum]|uniref:DRBM domain-containing protein n=1 Tax=Hebeloma cylindrosporum TaxID=76867 RepID=A0A0C2Z2U2_HEBCY|nr:hypothetical protein M413DRAFT_439259 [Hebeloma cylindrosporum h7]